MKRPHRAGRPVAGLIALDAVAVLVFAAIGRASHDEAAGIDAALGVLGTAAPFLGGAVVGALVARSWQAPLSWRSGVLTWIGAVGIGLALRWAITGRLPPAFVLVATLSLAVLVLGWRAVAQLIVRAGRRRRRGVRA